MIAGLTIGAARAQGDESLFARAALEPVSNTEEWVLRVIGRNEASVRDLVISEKVLVTGARGSVGSEIVRRLGAGLVRGVDIDDMDVTNFEQVSEVVADFDPDIIIHCAGAKHAPKGEEDPYDVMLVNAMGTKNVLLAARLAHARVITLSTGKACDPETAYGASKLVAERMTLNEPGGTVARLFNVVESSGNVFEIWRDTPKEAPVLVTRCSRRFITMNEAVGLVFYCVMAGEGRWSMGCSVPQTMSEVAHRLYPERDRVAMPPRRGDRIFEPEISFCEEAERSYEPFMQVFNPHDPGGLRR